MAAVRMIPPLRLRREKTGLSQAEVAAASGVSLRSYQCYESLETMPSVINAIRIAVVLRTTVEQIWGDLARF